MMKEFKVAQEVRIGTETINTLRFADAIAFGAELRKTCKTL